MNYKLLQTLKKAYRKSPQFVIDMVNDFRYRRSINNALELFLNSAEKGNSALCKELKRDILRCHKQYQTSPSEYFLYDFRTVKDNKYRDSFLCDEIKNKVMGELVGTDVFFNELSDKLNFYNLTSKYFNRGVLLFRGNVPYVVFKKFVLQYKDLFLKRNSSSKGKGVKAVTVENEHDAKELYNKLEKDGGDWIIEEKIIQVAEMGQWNNSSVNTVRLPAILNDDKWTVLGPVLRTGRKGAVVDNAGAGGIIAVINPDTGMITTDGVDESGKYYMKHPDSGVSYKGWQVPRWKELLTLAEEIQRSIPKHKYVGWDFALTDKGWVLIEGNWGQFLSQYNDHIGLKRYFLELLNYHC